MSWTITRLIHFLDENNRIPDDLPGPALKMVQFLGVIIQRMTGKAVNEVEMTDVPCRKKPGRKPCRGEILARFDAETEAIHWECTSCTDSGLIYDWQGTQWDLRSESDPETGTGDRLDYVIPEISEIKRGLENPEYASLENEHRDRELENSFLRYIKAYHEMDDGPKKTGRTLFDGIQVFPLAETLNPDEMTRILDVVHEVFHHHQLSMDLNPELSDTRIYTFLINEILDEEIPLFMPGNIMTHFDGCDGNCPACFQNDVCETYRDADWFEA